MATTANQPTPFTHVLTTLLDTGHIPQAVAKRLLDLHNAEIEVAFRKGAAEATQAMREGLDGLAKQTEA